MTERSVPIKLDRDYHLRFERVDIKAIENKLGVGYGYFLKPGIWGSITAIEAFIWRGLRVENEKGDLVHVFTMDDDGAEIAGDLVFAHIADHAGEINDAIFDGFISAGLFKLPKKGETHKEGDDTKNSQKIGSTSRKKQRLGSAG